MGKGLTSESRTFYEYSNVLGCCIYLRLRVDITRLYFLCSRGIIDAPGRVNNIDLMECKVWEKI